MDEKTLEESRLIAVAALMHDIGKFMQRASAKTKQSFDHSELSDAFFGEQSEVKYNEPYGFIDNLRFLVGHHHEKAIDESDKRGKLRVLAEILSEADNISSGEREIDTRKTIGLLIPILSQVSLEEKEPVSSQNFFLRLNPLSFSSPSDLLYPDVLSGISEENIESSYMKHWKDFFQEYRELVMANDKKLLPDSLFYLLEKYCWCIPSAYYQTQPDISLFEHSKITAALATCMHRFLSDSGNSIFNLDDPKKDKGVCQRS